MAGVMVTTVKRFIGTAAEIAAITLTGLPVGSTFFESDTGILKVLNTAGTLVNAPSETIALSGSNTPKSGQKNVTTAGTQVALGTTQVYKELTVIAKATNTGNIYVGDSTVDSTTGAILPAGGFLTFHFVDIADVYIDSDVNGEGVSFGGDV